MRNNNEILIESKPEAIHSVYRGVYKEFTYGRPGKPGSSIDSYEFTITLKEDTSDDFEPTAEIVFCKRDGLPWMTYIAIQEITKFFLDRQTKPTLIQRLKNLFK